MAFLYGFKILFTSDFTLTEILSAIKYHTVGAENMTSVEKIVYIADAIEYGRNYPSVIKIREETFKNLDRGILMEIEHKEKYLESIGKKSHPNTDELKKELLKKEEDLWI